METWKHDYPRLIAERLAAQHTEDTGTKGGGARETKEISPAHPYSVDRTKETLDGESTEK